MNKTGIGPQNHLYSSDGSGLKETTTTQYRSENIQSPNSTSVGEAKPVNEYGQSEADADHMKSKIGVKIRELYEQNLKVSKVKVALDAYASVY